jgi:predicted transcriptional regulator
MPRSAANLTPWLNEPVVQDAVVAVLTREPRSYLLREVVEECGIPVDSANRVLRRLHLKGFVERYKLPIQRHAYRHRRKKCVPGGARRMLYVYSWIEEPRAA